MITERKENFTNRRTSEISLKDDNVKKMPLNENPSKVLIERPNKITRL